MADTSVSYKCPHCDAPLSFQPGNDKVTCEYCGTELEISAVEELFQKKQEMAAKAQEAQEAKWDTEAAGGEWSEDEMAAMRTFTCSSCGAEIVADENTMATECCYCGNPTMLPNRFSGMLKPDFVIPFKKTKQDAVAALKEFYKGKRLLPDAFTANNRVEDIQPMYVPFWLFDSSVEAHAEFRAESVNVIDTSDETITETSVYSCTRSGTMDFEKIPVDGSSKMDNDYMESIEPFDYSELVPFSAAYFTGYLADKYDEDAENRSPAGYRGGLRQLFDGIFRRHQIGRQRLVCDGAGLDPDDALQRPAVHFHDERPDRKIRRQPALRQAEGDDVLRGIGCHCDVHYLFHSETVCLREV